jgi:uncharacterized protein YndB with AHSA1/START domain
MLRNTIYIPASRERVYEALTAFADYPVWVPDCEQCTVLSSSGPATIVDMSVGGARRMRMGIRYQGVPGQSLQFEKVSGKDLKTYFGHYRLVAAEDGIGTVVFSEAEIEVASVPRFLTDGLAKKSLDKGGLALKKRVEKLVAADRTAMASQATALPHRAPVRARRLLQIVKMPKNYRIRLLGEVFTVKNIGGNFL